MENILILGGTGAMGKFLVKRLSASYHVCVTSRKVHKSTDNVTYYQGDAHNDNFLKSILKNEKWLAIIDFMHYGTEEFKKRYQLLLANTAQYVFLSSSRVYAASETPLTEESLRLVDKVADKDFIRSDDYALAKARQEDLLKISGKDNWTCIRPYMTYDSYRMDLGFFPKELWLYRVLHGKSVLFPLDVASKKTTYTFGDDVAFCISCLIGNPEAKGNMYQIMQSKQHSWNEIIEIYKKALATKGFSMNIKYVRSMPLKEPIYIYDRIYNRIFDNSKINNITGGMEYKDVMEGIPKCVDEFLSNISFKDIDWKLQAYWDKILKENTSLTEIPGLKHKLEYLSFRYIVSYVVSKKALHFLKKVIKS